MVSDTEDGVETAEMNALFSRRPGSSGKKGMDASAKFIPGTETEWCVDLEGYGGKPAAEEVEYIAGSLKEAPDPAVELMMPGIPEIGRAHV